MRIVGSSTVAMARPVPGWTGRGTTEVVQASHLAGRRSSPFVYAGELTPSPRPVLTSAFPRRRTHSGGGLFFWALQLLHAGELTCRISSTQENSPSQRRETHT